MPPVHHSETAQKMQYNPLCGNRKSQSDCLRSRHPGGCIDTVRSRSVHPPVSGRHAGLERLVDVGRR